MRFTAIQIKVSFLIYLIDRACQLFLSLAGETYELCRWTVDLSTLPAFYYNAQHSTGGFYTEFDLGLILDSAEVLGTFVRSLTLEATRSLIFF